MEKYINRDDLDPKTKPSIVENQMSIISWISKIQFFKSKQKI